MDSLRYWVTEMHVEGFRFDLASTLARELHDVSPKLSSFFDTIHQDPTLADVKLIAEPWDVGDGGYQVGNFPVLWAEWNGKYRDTVRRFWKGDEGTLSDFAYRLTGSSDLYQYDGRKPYASINFITAHDGFTLCDLVSYNEEAQRSQRRRQQATAPTTMIAGTWARKARPTMSVINEIARTADAQLPGNTPDPLAGRSHALLAAMRVARSQRGNNNGYCQDDELTWYDWNLDAAAKEADGVYLAKLIKPCDSQASESAPAEVLPGPHDSRAPFVRDIAWYNTDGNRASG